MTNNEPVSPPEGNAAQPTVPLESYEEPAPAPVTPQYQEVVFVDAPVPPKRRGNRLAGVLLSLLATVILTVATAAAVLVIQYVNGTAFSLEFLANPTFYYPSILFFVGMALIVLIVNNAGWWTYIFTSLVVAAFVYFGTSALALVNDVARLTPSEASSAFFAGLAQPFTIVAALLARETAIWTGAVLGRRGRKVRLRNAEAQATYEREQAELASTGTAPA